MGAARFHTLCPISCVAWLLVLVNDWLHKGLFSVEHDIQHSVTTDKTCCAHEASNVPSSTTLNSKATFSPSTKVRDSKALSWGRCTDRVAITSQESADGRQDLTCNGNNACGSPLVLRCATWAPVCRAGPIVWWRLRGRHKVPIVIAVA